MDEDGTNLVGRSVLLQVPVDVADGSSEEQDNDDCGPTVIRYWLCCGVHKIQALHPMTSVNGQVSCDITRESSGKLAYIDRGGRGRPKRRSTGR